MTRQIAVGMGQGAVGIGGESTPVRIGVIGTGRAGRARVAAIRDDDRTELAFAASLRADPRLDEVEWHLADAVIVCAESARHFELAKLSLQHNKHVLVEYPLCHSGAEARLLGELADRTSRKLQVEVITVLSAGFSEFSRVLPPALDAVDPELGAPTIVRSTFRGGSYRWIRDEIDAGKFGQLALGRLHVLWKLLGPLTVERAAVVQENASHYKLTAALVASAARVTLEEERGPDVARGWTLDAQRAESMMPTVREEIVTMARARRNEQLFARDLGKFIDRIQGKSSPYIPMRDVVGATALAEQINRLAAAPSEPA